MSALTKTAINAAFKPLSHALLREGKTGVVARIAGFKVTALRQYQMPGRIGPVWNPHYVVEGGVPYGDRIIGVRSGTRDDMVAWLYANQKVAA